MQRLRGPWIDTLPSLHRAGTEQLGRLSGRQVGQLEESHELFVRQWGKYRRERVSAVAVTVAICAHDSNGPVRRRFDEPDEKRQTRRCRLMQVIQREQRPSGPTGVCNEA